MAAALGGIVPEELWGLLEAIARDDDLVFGLGQELESMRPGRAADVLRRNFDSDEALRSTICSILENEPAGLAHTGAIILFKKLGVDPASSTRLVPALSKFLLEGEPDDDTFGAALMLLNYCRKEEIPRETLRRLKRRTEELVRRDDMRSFAARARGFLDHGWFDA